MMILVVLLLVLLMTSLTWGDYVHTENTTEI